MADKRLRTMVFPGLEDTYTIPQDMNDLESIDAVAEPYDEFTAYVVGDYCSNGGKLYKCNTAIPSGETWNANHWTETNVGDEILAEKAATSTALSGKVSKAGDTMSGNLFINSPINTNYGIYEQSDYLDSTSAPSNDTYTIGLRFRDKKNVQTGMFNNGYLTTGNVVTQMIAQRPVNGSNVQNLLRLGVMLDGTRAVTLSDPDAWRSALGLGTSGALPITVAQGGTGQTGTISETTAANVATAATGFSISTAKFYQWGKVAQLFLSVKRTGASISSAQSIMFATINSGKRPVSDCGLWNETTTLLTSYMRAGGTVGAYGTWTQNTTFAFYATYILP